MRKVVPQEETNIKSILGVILINFEFIFIRKLILTQEIMIYLLTRWTNDKQYIVWAITN